MGRVATAARHAGRTRDNNTQPHNGNIERRRDAAWRLPPLPCGHRDPLVCHAPLPARPGPAYGLTEAEARAHANDLVTRWHWSVAEVAASLLIRPNGDIPR